MKKILYKTLLSIAVLMVVSCEDNSSNNNTRSAESTSQNNSGQGGSLARFAIAKNHLYVVDPSSIYAFDLTNARVPAYQSEDNIFSGVETIYPLNDYLYIGSTNGMFVYSIKSPSSPQYVSELQHIFSCDPVVADNNYAYVTLNDRFQSRCFRGVNQLDINDISDPTSPSLIRSYDMESPQGLGIDGNLLFVCDNGLKVFDVSNVDNIALLDHFPIVAHDVIPRNGILMVIGDNALIQYDYSNGQLELLSTIGL
jgi:hypothetical protein